MQVVSSRGATPTMQFMFLEHRSRVYVYRWGRVRIVKNELGGSATQQELRVWGFGRSQWKEQGNWGGG